MDTDEAPRWDSPSLVYFIDGNATLDLLDEEGLLGSPWCFFSVLGSTANYFGSSVIIS